MCIISVKKVLQKSVACDKIKTVKGDTQNEENKMIEMLK